MKVSVVKQPGFYVVDHKFEAPLSYLEDRKEKIDLFARELVSTDNAGRETMPYLVFFQGGPGNPSPRPVGYMGWMKRALRDFRVLLLDQRGTGRSSPISYQTLEKFDSPQDKADYLLNFRADSIVCDAELIRSQLIGEKTKWYGLGQSYGGFCLATYLSKSPEGLAGALITGGLPPVGVDIDDIYRATYKRCLRRNERYYERYQDDVDKVNQIVDYLIENKVLLPGGGLLTPERFQQLGISFGMTNGFEQVHYLIEDPFVKSGSRAELSYQFLKGVEGLQTFETTPIYSLLHEAIYCESNASNWSAHRIRDEFPQFNARSTSDTRFFTGEMIYPWMFDQYDYLHPMKEAAEILAKYDKWPALYDMEKLKENKVKVSACVYHDDMYVEREYSENLANIMGNTKIWVTNEYDHNGLRMDGYKIIDRLLTMLKGDTEH